MLQSIDRVIGFCAGYNERETETIFVQYLNFMSMRSKQRMKKAKLQTINISYVTFYHSTANMAHYLKSSFLKDL